MICVSSFSSLFSSSILRSSSGAKVGGIARVITIDDFLFLIAFLSAFSPSSYPKELLLLFRTIGVIAQYRSIFDARKRFALFSSTLRVDIIRAFETTLDGAVASDVAKVPEEGDGEKDVITPPHSTPRDKEGNIYTRRTNAVVGLCRCGRNAWCS